jgi:hypothetical protein
LLKIKIKTKIKPLPLTQPAIHVTKPPHPCYSLIITQLKKKNKEKENRKDSRLPLPHGSSSPKNEPPTSYLSF